MVDFLDGMREVGKTGGRQAAKIAGKTQGLFSSMLNGGNGLFTGLSTRLEAALNLSSDDDDRSTSEVNRSKEGCKEKPKKVTNGRKNSDVSDSSGCSYEQAHYFSGSHHPKRRLGKIVPKNRSVYGQPVLPSTNQSQSDLGRVKEFLDAIDKQTLKDNTQDPFERMRVQNSMEAMSSDEMSTSLDSSDVEQQGVDRSCSEASLQSWASSISYDSQPDEITVECMEFMKNFVDVLFRDSSGISLDEKAKFGELSQNEVGRLWFARYVNTQRVNRKKVDESTFYSLVQHFAIILFECFESDDFSPAKSLMNMCFTFYHEVPGCDPYKEFLYTYLKEQPIWQSLRFWNAAFFDAVQCERAHRPVVTREAFEQYSPEEVTDERQFQENITFGQLGTFTCNMHAFGLSKELCLEFLRKQSTIANIKHENVQMLRDNIDRMYRETDQWR